MPLSDLHIAALVEKYLRERDRFDKLSEVVTRHLRAQLHDAVIPHIASNRSKHPDSFRGKLVRNRESLSFDQFEREFTPTVLDLAGVRILVYRPTDRPQVVNIITELFEIPDDPRFSKDHCNNEGYRARHRVVELPKSMTESDPALANLAGVLCEIQVATLVDHVWNELEHDIKYKTPHGRPGDAQVAWLGALRGALDNAEKNILSLVEATDKQIAENIAEIDGPENLRRVLEQRTRRPLSGDFARLFDLLDGSHRQLSPATLDRLGIDFNTLEQRCEDAELLESASLDRLDDVDELVVRLWSDHGRDFFEIASAWHGRRGSLARLVLALYSQAKGQP